MKLSRISTSYRRNMIRRTSSCHFCPQLVPVQGGSLVTRQQQQTPGSLQGKTAKKDSACASLSTHPPSLFKMLFQTPQSRQILFAM